MGIVLLLAFCAMVGYSVKTSKSSSLNLALVIAMALAVFVPMTFRVTTEGVYYARPYSMEGVESVSMAVKVSMISPRNSRYMFLPDSLGTRVSSSNILSCIPFEIKHKFFTGEKALVMLSSPENVLIEVKCGYTLFGAMKVGRSKVVVLPSEYISGLKVYNPEWSKFEDRIDKDVTPSSEPSEK